MSPLTLAAMPKAENQLAVGGGTAEVARWFGSTAPATIKVAALRTFYNCIALASADATKALDNADNRGFFIEEFA